MKKVFLFFLFLLLTTASSFSQDCYRLLYVIDGDTIKILYHGKKTSVRLSEIDTPESRKNRRAYYQARKNYQDVETIVYLGKQAKRHLKELLARYEQVCLVYDQNNAYHNHRDRYGRILAYVYTPDGKFINKLMLEDGYAYLFTRYPLEPEYEQELRKAFKKAIEEEKGLWK
ncbi:thermonuclease family protein [Desulfurobacterium atlanticum]|uniref:Micrococcal nuclease n=1 Tax=Desulfurobacterium atlanticum TaxID=240169 RepID=A0A238Y5R9_9BACT|nr:thermonuclease family protein [Desulfurobacterium atlanticum]SNR66447.1 micrococcal nuclease [Desulfurobacterium atlanticum]